MISRFSTDALPKIDRLPIFVEEFSRKMARLDVFPLSGTAFKVELGALALGDVKCVTLNTTPAAFGRSGELLRDGSDDFVLLINRGPALYDDRKGTQIETGQATLQDSTQPGYVRLTDGGGGLSISLPRNRLLNLVPDAEDLARSARSPTPNHVGLLAAYLDVMIGAHETADAGRTFGNHVLDLVALSLDARGDAAEQARRKGLRASRASFIRQSVERLFGDPSLSLSMIAKMHRISERSVQLAFEDAGTTFTEYVLEGRLRSAYRQLSNPLLMHKPISDIAYDSGFGDISHFNRCFKRRFAATPSDVRRGCGQ